MTEPTGAASGLWSDPARLSEGLAWARSILEAHGYAPEENAAELKRWCLSAIYRIETVRGRALFKAVPPMFAHEGAVMRFVEATMPLAVPHVVATDGARGWTLMEELNGEPLRRAGSKRRSEALRVLARVQKASINRESELLTIGCPDRRLRNLAAASAELIARPDVRSALTSEELASLDALTPELPSRVEALARFRVPESLIHGDFHHGNIIDAGSELKVIDWTDACISHPFFDLATFVDALKPEESSATQQQYLDQWRDLMPSTDLRKAAALAAPLAFLHHAINYARIVDGVGPDARGDIGLGPEGWLRRLLALESSARAAN